MAEVLSDFLVQRAAGYYCRYGDFYLDPTSPVARAVVSHAHGDHATPGHQEIYCTMATAAFVLHRFPRQPRDSFHRQEFHQSFLINGVKVSFIPAGHILGSAQILMEHRGTRYLYTGDYKLQADPTCEPIEATCADVLVTESTFANPDVKHPDPVSEIKKLNEKPFNILLGTYSLGKAQRLTWLINTYCPEKEVLLHYNILPIHQLYELFGAKKMKYKPYNRKEMKTGQGNKIYMVPPMTFNSYFRATNVLRVFASGWSHLQKQNDLSLYISDHVDWDDILAYIKEVSPQEIWTIHGDGRPLQNHFKGSLPVRPMLVEQ